MIMTQIQRKRLQRVEVKVKAKEITYQTPVHEMMNQIMAEVMVEEVDHEDYEGVPKDRNHITQTRTTKDTYHTTNKPQSQNTKNYQSSDTH